VPNVEIAAVCHQVAVLVGADPLPLGLTVRLFTSNALLLRPDSSTRLHLYQAVKFRHNVPDRLVKTRALLQ
jgi:hypothetical protein